MSQSQANYETQLFNKGNILQYKKNSAQLTKSQRYAQLAKGMGASRTKVFATQSQTYSNPNTTNLERVGYETYTYQNEIVSAPNNLSGPFAYGISNPNGCSGTDIQVGGTLVNGTFVNPCSNKIIKTCQKSATIYNPASASGVPGNSILAWNDNIISWIPKTRYVMNNSTDKWPVNYNFFGNSALTILPLSITSNMVTSTDVLASNMVTSNMVTSTDVLASNMVTDTHIESNIKTPIIKPRVPIPPPIPKPPTKPPKPKPLTMANIDQLLTLKLTPINVILNNIDLNVTQIIHQVDLIIVLVNICITYLKKCCPDNASSNCGNCDDDNNKCDCTLYNYISSNSAITQINAYVQTYITNINDPTSNTYINIDEFNTLNIGLVSLAEIIDPSCCFINVIDTFRNMLYVVKSGFDNKILAQSALTGAESWHQDSITLHDNTLLRDYLEKLSKSATVLSFSVTAPIIEIKPKYVIYHNLYGVPPNLNYDPRLLEDIIENMVVSALAAQDISIQELCAEGITIQDLCMDMETKDEV
jgi:hypothetical protein